MAGKDNWTIRFGPGTTENCSLYITSQRQNGTIEEKAAIAMQNLVDLAQFAVPPATSCSLSATQVTNPQPSPISSRSISIQFSYSNT